MSLESFPYSYRRTQGFPRQCCDLEYNFCNRPGERKRRFPAIRMKMTLSLYIKNSAHSMRVPRLVHYVLFDKIEVILHAAPDGGLKVVSPW